MLRRPFRWFLLLASIVAPACSAGCPKPVIGNASAVVLLLDYSKSFAPYTASDTAALNEAGKSMVQMLRTGSLPQPLKILWAAFGDNGLQPIEPCGPPRVFSQRLTGGSSAPGGGKKSSERLSSIGELESWLGVCSTAVRATSQTTSQFTDITGALTFGADAVSDVSDERVIVLFTDLLDDLPRNRQRAPLKLPSSRVLLIWRPGLDDQKQPERLSARIDEWRTKLEEAGASRVCAKAARGLTEGEISSCLWK
jgi:hypothetical protein